jgi:hypothetical protein
MMCIDDPAFLALFCPDEEKTTSYCHTSVLLPCGPKLGQRRAAREKTGED